MGKKKQSEGYSDALSSIFDFIFAQAEKPIDKRKPIRPTGVSGTSEFTNAMATVLENPGTFVSNATMDSITAMTVNADFIKIDVDKQDNNLEIKTNDVASFLKDPNKFIDKAYKDAEAVRKANRIRWMSNGLQEVIGTAWATKNGFNTHEAKAIGEAIGGSLNDDRIKEIIVNGEKKNVAEQGYLTKINIPILGQKEWGMGLGKAYDQSSKLHRGGITNAVKGKEALRALGEAWRVGGGTDPIQRAELFAKAREYLSKNGGEALFGNLGVILKDQNIDESLKQNIERSFKPNPEKIGKTELQSMSVYFGNKKEQASTDEEKEKYSKAENLMNNLQKRSYLEDIREEIKKTQENIKDIRGNDPKSGLIKGLDDYLRDLKDQEKLLGNYKLVETLGKLEGFRNAWNASYGMIKDGKLLPNILTGNFFDNRPHKNMLFSPSEKGLYKYGSGKRDVIKFNKVRKIAQVPYASWMAEALNGLYYITPAGIVSTLTTGEGFAYARHLLFESLKKDGLNRMAGIKELCNAEGVFDLENLLKDKDKMNLLLDYIAKNPNKPVSKMLAHALNSEKQLGKLAKMFSLGTSIKNAIGDIGLNIARKIFKDTTSETIRDVVTKYIGTKFLTTGLWRSAERYITKRLGADVAKKVASLLAKEGFNSAISAIAAALGTTLGPAGTIVAFVLSEVVMEIGYQLVRVVILLLMLLTLSFIGILGAILIGSGGMYVSALTQQHSNVTPNDIVKCDAYTGTEYVDDTDGNPLGPVGEFVAGKLPSGEQCLLGTSSYRCTQGMYGTYSHASTPANDIVGVEYVYAPAFCGDNNCFVTHVSDISCTAGYAGGWVIFTAEYKGTTYQFSMVHVYTTHSVGDSLDSGEAVARVMTHEETGNACSSGMHLHLRTNVNGSIVDPLEVLTSPTTSGGFGCEIEACP